jgi:hypothetical protein
MKSSAILALLGYIAFADFTNAYKNTLFECVALNYCSNRNVGFTSCIKEFDQASQEILDTYYKRLFPNPTILGRDTTRFCANRPLIEKTFDDFTNDVERVERNEQEKEEFDTGVQCLRDKVEQCANMPVFNS